jgi:hypothetical protein
MAQLPWFIKLAQSTPSKRATALDALSEDDRVWLTERLVEYRELLDYLHAN